MSAILPASKQRFLLGRGYNTIVAPVLQLQYRYTSIIKCFLISTQDFEVDRA